MNRKTIKGRKEKISKKNRKKEKILDKERRKQKEKQQ